MEERSMRKKPVVLMVLDGYGLNDKVEGNAVAQANTPVMDSLMKEYPFVHGNASGMAVGLPEGQMGNSEVGHMNMGAGWEERIAVLKDDSVKNPVFRPLNYVELLMYTDLQPENGYVWVNTACAEYYGKESVTVTTGTAGE